MAGRADFEINVAGRHPVMLVVDTLEPSTPSTQHSSNDSVLTNNPWALEAGHLGCMAEAYGDISEAVEESLEEFAVLEP